MGRCGGAQGQVAVMRQAQADDRGRSGRAPPSPGYRGRPPRSCLVRAKRGNPVGVQPSGWSADRKGRAVCSHASSRGEPALEPSGAGALEVSTLAHEPADTGKQERADRSAFQNLASGMTSANEPLHELLLTVSDIRVLIHEYHELGARNSDVAPPLAPCTAARPVHRQLSSQQ
jgi:hypothetical protein